MIYVTFVSSPIGAEPLGGNANAHVAAYARAWSARNWQPRQGPRADHQGLPGRAAGPAVGLPSGMRSAVVSSAVLSIDARSKACRLLLSSGRFERARGRTQSPVKHADARCKIGDGWSVPVAVFTQEIGTELPVRLREPHSWPTGVRIEGRRLKPW